jgi:uncharacterized protein (DUF433 family)
MTGHPHNFLNTGIYTVPEAARLTRVSVGRIRRWLRGYKFRTRKGEQHFSPALWHGQLKAIDHSHALGFLDLIEIRFVDAFLKKGVSWGIIREAHVRGAKLFNTNHPFCTNKFFTCGREIFVEIHRETKEPSLLDIAHDQHVFAQIVRPFLQELEFDENDQLLRWKPTTKRGLVVLDPTRNFGRPIVTRHGVPTEVLARAAKACDSVEEVAQWYEVPKSEIEDAMEFEHELTLAA